MRTWGIGFLMVFLLGCVPYSDNPLTDPEKTKIDPAILGTWYWKEQQESGYVHIGLDNESKLLRVVVAEFDKDGGLKVSEYAGHTSSLGDMSYLNLKELRPPGEQQGYLFVKYRIQGERLGISIINHQAVVAAIKDGRIRGRIQEGQWVSSAQITESQQPLRQFILKHDKDLFKDETRLHRLNLPYHRMRPTTDSASETKREEHRQAVLTAGPNRLLAVFGDSGTTELPVTECGMLFPTLHTSWRPVTQGVVDVAFEKGLPRPQSPDGPQGTPGPGEVFPLLTASPKVFLLLAFREFSKGEKQGWNRPTIPLSYLLTLSQIRCYSQRGCVGKT